MKEATKKQTIRMIENAPASAYFDGVLTHNQALELRPTAKQAANQWAEGLITIHEARRKALGGLN